jgi:hypothetical protein
MSTPTAPQPYTPQQVLNNLQNFVAELDNYPANEQSGPSYVLHCCQDILKRGIESPALPTEPGSLLDDLANVTAALDTVLIHQGQHMTPEDRYQRQMLVAATKHTLKQHGIKL